MRNDNEKRHTFKAACDEYFQQNKALLKFVAAAFVVLVVVICLRVMS
jgi:hypothetical protein